MSGFEMTVLALGIWFLPALFVGALIAWKSRTYEGADYEAASRLRWHLAHYDEATRQAEEADPRSLDQEAAMLQRTFMTDQQATSSYDILIVPGPCVRYPNNSHEGLWGHIPLRTSTSSGACVAGAWAVYLN